jgi:hypothetical protein
MLVSALQTLRPSHNMITGHQCFGNRRQYDVSDAFAIERAWTVVNQMEVVFGRPRQRDNERKRQQTKEPKSPNNKKPK